MVNDSAYRLGRLGFLYPDCRLDPIPGVERSEAQNGKSRRCRRIDFGDCRRDLVCACHSRRLGQCHDVLIGHDSLAVPRFADAVWLPLQGRSVFSLEREAFSTVRPLHRRAGRGCGGSVELCRFSSRPGCVGPFTGADAYRRRRASSHAV